jgi:pimeloyl-ACP methyl ester carboxylesterase
MHALAVPLTVPLSWGLFLLGQDSPVLPGPYEPGARSTWVIEQAGQRLGECSSQYQGEVALAALRAHHFREQVRLELPAPSGKVEQRFTVELWTDAAGHPLRFDFRARLGDVKSAVEGVFADGKVELVVRQGPSERKLAVEAPAASYLLANNFVSELELCLVAVPPADAGTRTLFSPNVLRSVPYSLKSVEVPAGTSVFEDSLGERLHWSDEGRLERVEVPAQRIEMRRVETHPEPFAIELPARLGLDAGLEREEVEIVDGDVSLAGTITRPKGASGRLPALTFLSGSGPQDREGISAGLDLGTHEILDRLTREGFLVLRVDDRGVGQSRGPTADMTFGGLVEDGRRALRHLRARADVDPERVALVGHSEGALSATVLAASEPVAAIVLMAGPGRPLEALLREQLLAGRAGAGAKPDELTAFGLEIDAYLAAIAKGEPLTAERLPPELAAFLPARAWLASHVGRDPLPFLKAVRCPILVLQGGRDVQVSAERDAPRVVAALDAVKHPDHELVLLPALDHLFKKASDPPSELDYLLARPVDPEFLDVLSAWLRARLVR